MSSAKKKQADKLVKSEKVDKLKKSENSKKADTSEKVEKSKKSEKSPDASRNLESVFVEFAKFGDRQNDGSTITLKNLDKWLQQADILNNKELGVKQADTAITFHKIVKNKKRMEFEDFHNFVETLAKDKKLEANSLIEKLVAARAPSVTNVTVPVKTGAVGENLKRMTDVSKYTGAHKARFDEEGKGKGLEGRKDFQSDTGYVTGFKPAGTSEDRDNS